MEDKSIDFDNESEYIIIPNPIYDVVFKYLMEDNESAKIVSLEPQPLSYSEKKDAEEYEGELRETRN